MKKVYLVCFRMFRIPTPKFLQQSQRLSGTDVILCINTSVVFSGFSWHICHNNLSTY